MRTFIQLLTVLISVSVVGHAYAVDLPRVWGPSHKEAPDTIVQFPSLDGETQVDGLIWYPQGYNELETYPVVVMAHGCGGVYWQTPWIPQNVAGKFQVWGKLLSEAGFIAILVDSFSPRHDLDLPGFEFDDDGEDDGVCETAAEDRPEELNEATTRVEDIYGAYQYLATQTDVDMDRLGLLGWSNGGSTVLSAVAATNTVFENFPDIAQANPFQQAVSFYPGCGLQDEFADEYEVVVPLRVNVAEYDVVLSPGENFYEEHIAKCNILKDLAEEHNNNYQQIIYKYQPHQFDYVVPGFKAAHHAVNSALDLFGQM